MSTQTGESVLAKKGGRLALATVLALVFYLTVQVLIVQDFFSIQVCSSNFSFQQNNIDYCKNSYKSEAKAYIDNRDVRSEKI